MKQFIALAVVLVSLSVANGGILGKKGKYFRIVEVDSDHHHSQDFEDHSAAASSSIYSLTSARSSASSRQPDLQPAAQTTSFAAVRRAPLLSSFDATNNQPMPYEFAYQTADHEGSASTRQEKADGSGRVEGSYSFTLADGRSRTVNYVADHEGYRAAVSTNEFGTESKDPADVKFESTAEPAAEAAIREEPNRLRNAASRFSAQASSASATYLPAPSTLTTSESRISNFATEKKSRKAKKFLLVPVEVDDFHDH